MYVYMYERVYYSYILSVLDSSHVAFFYTAGYDGVLACATRVYRRGGLNFIRFRSDIAQWHVCVCVYKKRFHTLGRRTAHGHRLRVCKEVEYKMYNMCYDFLGVRCAGAEDDRKTNGRAIIYR